jgi:hypothetical protein
MLSANCDWTAYCASLKAAWFEITLGFQAQQQSLPGQGKFTLEKAKAEVSHRVPLNWNCSICISGFFLFIFVSLLSASLTQAGARLYLAQPYSSNRLDHYAAGHGRSFSIII